MYYCALIDSINLKSSTFENLLNEDFSVENIKGIGVFHPYRWLQEFGKMINKNIVEAKIIHCINSCTLPLKRYASQPSLQVLEFAGINGYTERSILLKKVFNSLKSKLDDCYIVRLDIAIDLPCIPKYVEKELLSHRKAFTYANTIYYKTEKEKKTNLYLDIKSYDKALRDGLTYPLHRIEFCFKGQYFKKLKYKDLESLFSKLEKGIKKFSGLEVKIQSL